MHSVFLIFANYSKTLNINNIYKNFQSNALFGKYTGTSLQFLNIFSDSELN